MTQPLALCECGRVRSEASAERFRSHTLRTRELRRHWSSAERKAGLLYGARCFNSYDIKLMYALACSAIQYFYISVTMDLQLLRRLMGLKEWVIVVAAKRQP